MKFSDINNHIGKQVFLNGEGDLAMDGEFRPFLYPTPNPRPVFIILKTTRGGRVLILDPKGHHHAVNARNIDLV